MKHLRISTYRSALVDDEDYERCKVFRWHIKKNFTRREGRKVYHEHVYTVVRYNGKDRHLHLARHILGVGDSKRVRYKTSDHLDCRKANLVLESIRQDVPRLKGIGLAEISHAEMLEAIDSDIEDFINARRTPIPTVDESRPSGSIL